MNNEEKNKLFAFDRIGYAILGIGFLLVIVGFIIMSGGNSPSPDEFNEEIFNFRRVTLAPIIVLIGFVVVLYAIMRKPTSDN